MIKLLSTIAFAAIAVTAHAKEPATMFSEADFKQLTFLEGRMTMALARLK